MKRMTIAVSALTLMACVAAAADDGYWRHRSHRDQARFQRDANECRRGESERSCMRARGYSWQTDSVGSRANTLRMVEFNARQVGCATPPLSQTVESPGVEVFQFQCGGGRVVTFKCQQGSCAGE